MSFPTGVLKSAKKSGLCSTRSLILDVIDNGAALLSNDLNAPLAANAFRVAPKIIKLQVVVLQNNVDDVNSSFADGTDLASACSLHTNANALVDQMRQTTQAELGENLLSSSSDCTGNKEGCSPSALTKSALHKPTAFDTLGIELHRSDAQAFESHASAVIICNLAIAKHAMNEGDAALQLFDLADQLFASIGSPCTHLRVRWAILQNVVHILRGEGQEAKDLEEEKLAIEVHMLFTSKTTAHAA